MKSAVERLRRLGMSARAATDKGPLFTRANRVLDSSGAAARRWSIWVPGRIEVMGKHTDYAGGRSLLCALERGFCVRVAPRRDPTIRVTDAARDLQFETTLGAPTRTAPGAWERYVEVVATRLGRNFPSLRRGADIAFASDLPPAAGMSSSSALVTATFMALSKANNLRSSAEFRSVISSREELAAYLGAVENGLSFGSLAGEAGVGTHGGSEDHTSMLCSETGRLGRYWFSPVRREAGYQLPDGYTFALGACGVDAAKTGAALGSYNGAALAVHKLLESWNQETSRHDATLALAAMSSTTATDQLRGLANGLRSEDGSPTYVRGRLEQFLAETFVLIPAACDALLRSALGELGIVVDRSQRLAEDMLGNQVPQTVRLQQLARELGAVAASAFGAGFGGSVWALIPSRKAAVFLAQWEARYAEVFPELRARAQFFVSPAGPSAYQW